MSDRCFHAVKDYNKHKETYSESKGFFGKMAYKTEN